MDITICDLQHKKLRQSKANQIDMERESNEYPLLIDRIKSTMIDTVLLIALMFICSKALGGPPDSAGGVRAVCFVTVFVLYDPLCTAFGCTVGNYFIKIRVRRNDDHSKRINFFFALIRYIVKVLLGWISFLTIHSNRERRAIHDMAAGSVMVKLAGSSTVVQVAQIN